MIKLAILIISLLILHGSAEQQVCTKLHMGSEIKEGGHSSNIIANGIPSEFYKSGNLLVSASKNLDFLYLSELDIDLQETNIALFYDNNEHLKAQALLKKEQDKGYYTIEVSYNCDSYGALFANITLEINIPNCGGASLNWKKLCGNPFTIREGLSMELAYGEFKPQLIVKNGRPLEPKYWDRDIDDLAFQLPTSYNRIRLEMYMNPDDISNDTNTSMVHAFGNINQNNNKKFNLNTFVSTVRVDSDKNIVTAEITGNAVHGVQITNNTREIIDIVFNCTENGGVSTIELDVILPAFHDVTLFFVKKCEGKALFSQGNEATQILTFWLTMAVIAGFCYFTYKNVTEHGKKGISAVPFYDEIRGAYNKVKKMSRKEMTLGSDDHELKGIKHTKLTNQDEDEDYRKVNTNDSFQHVSKINTYGALANE